jgi:hypothetical protein
MGINMILPHVNGCAIRLDMYVLMRNVFYQFALFLVIHFLFLQLLCFFSSNLNPTMSTSLKLVVCRTKLSTAIFVLFT